MIAAAAAMRVPPGACACFPRRKRRGRAGCLPRFVHRRACRPTVHSRRCATGRGKLRRAGAQTYDPRIASGVRHEYRRAFEHQPPTRVHADGAHGDASRSSRSWPPSRCRATRRHHAQPARRRAHAAGRPADPDGEVLPGQPHVLTTAAACGVAAGQLATYNADPGRSFDFTCPSADLTANTYRLVATGRASKSMNGFMLDVDQAGAKSSTGPAGWTAAPNCWFVRKDGSCS